MQPDTHRAASTLAIAIAVTDRPAPSAPSRLPLEALTLTALGIQAEEPGDGPAHRVEVVAEPRARSDECHVHGDGPPTGVLDPPADLADEQPARDAFGRPVVCREDAPEVAQGTRAQQGIGDGVKGDVAVGMSGQAGRPGDLDATQDQRRAGPERVTVVTYPRPGRAACCECRGGTTEIAGKRHLEIAWIAGDDMDRDATGFQQRGLVGERRRAIGGKAPVGVAQQLAGRPLGSLGRPEVVSIHGRADKPAVDALEGLGDLDERDRSPVASGRLRHGGDQGRLDEWPRRIVDEDHPAPARIEPLERDETRMDRFLAARSAHHDIDHARRQPGGARDVCQPLARGHDDDPLDLRRRRQRGERPREQRATVDLDGQLVGAAHPR